MERVCACTHARCVRVQRAVYNYDDFFFLCDVVCVKTGAACPPSPTPPVCFFPPLYSQRLLSPTRTAPFLSSVCLFYRVGFVWRENGAALFLVATLSFGRAPFPKLHTCFTGLPSLSRSHTHPSASTSSSSRRRPPSTAAAATVAATARPLSPSDTRIPSNAATARAATMRPGSEAASGGRPG